MQLISSEGGQRTEGKRGGKKETTPGLLPGPERVENTFADLPIPDGRPQHLGLWRNH